MSTTIVVVTPCRRRCDSSTRCEIHVYLSIHRSLRWSLTNNSQKYSDCLSLSRLTLTIFSFPPQPFPVLIRQLCGYIALFGIYSLCVNLFAVLNADIWCQIKRHFTSFHAWAAPAGWQRGQLSPCALCPAPGCSPVVVSKKLYVPSGHFPSIVAP